MARAAERKIRAACYTRVSTLEQCRDKSSLDQQLERCEAYCAAHEWEVTGHYEDAGESGKKRERPALTKLFTHAKEGHFDVVVFHKLDRFARSVRDLQNIVHELKGLGIDIASVHESVDTTTPSGRLFLTMLGGFAEFEADVINERMSGGRQASFAGGKFVLSCVPYGYVKEDGELAEHPEHAAVVRRIFTMSANGLGIVAIATKLSEEGVPPPSTRARHGWTHASVHKLLTHRRYIGEVEYAGEKRQGLALIDEKLFARVQLGLKGRRQYENPRTEKTLHLLAGLLRCRHCGGRYRAVRWGDDSKRYFCATAKREGKKVRHKGVKTWWKPEELEAAAVKFISDFMEDPMAVLSLILEWHEDHKGLADEDPLPGLEAALEKSDEERKRLIKLARKGRISEADMVEQLAEVKRERAETETRIAEVKAARTVEPGEVEVVGALIKKRDEAYILNHEEDPSQWSEQALQAALRHVIETVWVEDDGFLTAESRYLEPDQSLQRDQSHTPS